MRSLLREESHYKYMCKDEMTNFVCCKDEIKKKRKRERSKIKLMREEKRNDKSIAYTGLYAVDQGPICGGVYYNNLYTLLIHKS